MAKEEIVIGSLGTRRFLSGAIAMVAMTVLILITVLVAVLVMPEGAAALLGALTGPLGVFAGLAATIVWRGNTHDTAARTAIIESLRAPAERPLGRE